MLTSFIGRERDVASIRQLLVTQQVRLVTLTGPPGVGKTRLALEVAGSLTDWYQHGVAFVDLSPIADPGLVSKVIASSLGLWEVSRRPIDEQLREYLRSRELLLLLDNFEQVADAAAGVAGLLETCRALRLIVTSRAPLHIGWEHEWLVNPLGVPPVDENLSASELEAHHAVALFVHRAHAVQSDFALTDGNRLAVAEICARLDGLPLAIEFAATRIKTLSPHAILERLNRRLPMLSTLGRDVPPRHQTLRAAIGWSYALLGPDEQSLFRRLGIFSGGCSLEAVEAVAGELVTNAFEIIGSLVDQSLLQHDARPDSSARFRMLETIREFALEQLSLTGELEPVRRLHAAYFRRLGEQADEGLTRVHETGWLHRLAAEHDNLQAAFEWMLSNGDADALSLAQSLWPYWSGHGHYAEGREWLERSLAQRSQPSPPLPMVKALLAAGAMAGSQDDYDRSARYLERGIELGRTHGEAVWVAWGLAALGHITWHQGHAARAIALCSESRSSPGAAQEPWVMAFALAQSAAVAWHEEDYPLTEAYAEQALALAPEIVQRIGSPSPRALLGMSAWHRRDLARAEALFRRDLAVARSHGDRLRMAVSLVWFGDVAQARGRQGEAWSAYREALPMLHEMEEHWFRTACLKGMATVAVAGGQPWAAARLLGAADASEEGLPARAPSSSVSRRIQAALGAEAFDAARADGYAMSLDQAVSYALEVGKALQGPQAGRRGQALSAREREVAALLSQGLSNRQIGEALTVTEKTVAHHVQHILDKLDFRSRARVAAWAVTQGLAGEPTDA